MSRTVVVVNPKSQHGALGRRWSHVARVLEREIGSFETARTEGPGDATRLTREALESGADRVIAVGGDGTVCEVVNGFFDGERPRAPEAALGIVPFGTGGDFRRTAGVPHDLGKAAALLASGRRRTVDVGLLQLTDRDGGTRTQVFANIASFGISGVVDRLVNQSSKRLGGRISFFMSTVRASLGYSNQRVRLWFDDNPDDAVDMTINTVAVANGRYFGGGMFVAPEAELDDGYFDVVAIGDLTRSEVFLSGPRIYRGTHLTMDKVSHRRARVVHAEPIDGEVVELDVDGETPGILPASFRILPGALSLIAPG